MSLLSATSARQRRVTWTLVGLLLAAGLLAYWPVLSMNFFWEDPFDIGQVDQLSYSDLLLVPNSNSYYRPLALVLLKALKLGGATFQPLPYHAFVVAGHLLSGVLLFGLAKRLFGRNDLAATAGLIYLLYPPGYEATARAPSMHHWLTAATFASLWLYLQGRETGRRGPLIAALVVMTLAQTLHENGLSFPALVLILEVWLVWRKRVPKFDPLSLIYFIPAVVYLLIWLSIPKSGEPPSLGLHPREALLLSQGISFPVAGLFSSAGGLGLPAPWQAGIALALALGFLYWSHRRGNEPRLALALAWWAAAISLAWLARPFEYLDVSPRVLYYPSFAASLAWAGVIDFGTGWLKPAGRQRLAGDIARVAVLLHCLLFQARATALYTAGSQLMDQIIQAGGAARENTRLLFVNVPDRFQYRYTMYPLGYWGMLVAPVSQDLSDFVEFAAGRRIETRSLSEFRQLAAATAESPYQVNTRGEDADAATFYEAAHWADLAYLTTYSPRGAIGVVAVGSVTAASSTGQCPVTFGEVASLCEVEVSAGQGILKVALTWRALASSAPNDTVFVHVFDESGTLAAGSDGDSLGGLVPLSAWHSGDVITDVRRIPLPPGLGVGRYQVRVGLYNRASGERLRAVEADGAEVADDAWPAAEVELP